MEITKQMANELCDALDLDSSFFDEDGEEYILMKDNNPSLLEAYEALFTIANGD